MRRDFKISPEDKKFIMSEEVEKAAKDIDAASERVQGVPLVHYEGMLTSMRYSKDQNMDDGTYNLFQTIIESFREYLEPK